MSTAGPNVLVETYSGPRLRATLSDQAPIIGDDTVGAKSLESTLADVRRGTYRFRKSWANPGAGAQDVILFATGALPGAPRNFRVVDVLLQVSNAGATGGTATLRDAAAGAGNAVSSGLSTNATGTVRNADTQSRLVASSAGLYLRLSDGTTSGEVWVEVAPE